MVGPAYDPLSSCARVGVARGRSTSRSWTAEVQAQRKARRHPTGAVLHPLAVKRAPCICAAKPGSAGGARSRSGLRGPLRSRPAPKHTPNIVTDSPPGVLWDRVPPCFPRSTCRSRHPLEGSSTPSRHRPPTTSSWPGARKRRVATVSPPVPACPNLGDDRRW